MKRPIAALAVFLALGCLCACQRQGKEPSDAYSSVGLFAEHQPNQNRTGELPDNTSDGIINPLTGLADGITKDKLNRRPVAIMVSNSADSLPQWGISQADIIYEMLAEGRITRLVALFQDPSKIDKLASIRSARPYFIDIAQSYGAVYLHFGGSVPAYDAIKARSDLIHIDGLEGNWEGTLFIRDAERRKTFSLEHTVTITGGKIEEALAKLNIPLEQKGNPSAFSFGEKHSAVDGGPAQKITVTFSDKFNPYFTYDKESGNYLRFQYGEKHWDGWQKKQISVKNIFVLRMKLTDVPNSSLKLVEIGTTGTGTGYYCCGGKYIEVTWKKDKYNSEIEFFDRNGKELVVARGQTFISVVSETANVTIDG